MSIIYLKERLSITKMQKKSNSPSLREKDPFLAREQQRYDHPLPSREWVIELLQKEGVPLKIEALANKLSITEAEQEFFERRIKAMAVQARRSGVDQPARCRVCGRQAGIGEMPRGSA